MTILKLIEKLQNENGDNGCYNVLKIYYQDLQVTKNKKDESMGHTSKIKDYLILSQRIDELYNYINGFIWGLKTLDYITKIEMDELQEDLAKSL